MDRYADNNGKNGLAQISQGGIFYNKLTPTSGLISGIRVSIFLQRLPPECY
jgi:hypothetical protein